MNEYLRASFSIILGPLIVICQPLSRLRLTLQQLLDADVEAQLADVIHEQLVKVVVHQVI